MAASLDSLVMAELLLAGLLHQNDVPGDQGPAGVQGPQGVQGP